MRVLITASGLQDYIFNISHRAASTRLRGRSARLGLILDCCLSRFQERFGSEFDTNRDIRRNSGTRLELEFAQAPAGLESFLAELQHALDQHSLRDLDGQVWFAVAAADGRREAYGRLAKAKLRMGQRAIKDGADSEKAQWNEANFLFHPQVNERGIGKTEASVLPEAEFGQDLARSNNKYVHFTSLGGKHGIPVLDAFAKAAEEDPGEGFRLGLTEVTQTGDPKLLRKRVARHAPLGGHGRLLDFDEIADRAAGAKFLGLLKADMDSLGSTFSKFGSDGKGERQSRELSAKLEVLFTDELEGLVKTTFADCYIVYSGGDDLFMLGPWDQLIRFTAAFQALLRRSVESWGYPQLTLSAAYKVAHPKSPVRHLAEDIEAALEAAKKHRKSGEKDPHKNCICIFERVVAWDELREGLEWANRFMNGANSQGLSTAFLQRFQYYADQFHRFFDRKQVEGLRAVPLLQNDWLRNVERIQDPLRSQLGNVWPHLVEPTDTGARMWRVLEFASRFAVYALR